MTKSDDLNDVNSLYLHFGHQSENSKILKMNIFETTETDDLKDVRGIKKKKFSFF